MADGEADGVLEGIARINLAAGKLLAQLLEARISPADEVAFGEVLVEAGEALRWDGQERHAQDDDREPAVEVVER